MTSTLAALIPAAVGFALSPVSLVEFILVLFSRRRTANTIVFIVLLLVLTAAGVAMGAAGGSAAGTSGAPGTGAAVAFVVLGGLLILLAVRNWRTRADRSMPAILGTIEGMRPWAVALLTPGVTLLNPKNLVILLAAGGTIGQSHGGVDAVLIGAAFVLMATLPYTVGSAYALFGGAGAERRLGAAKEWLIGNNRAIMAAICAVLGLVLLAKGVTAL